MGDAEAKAAAGFIGSFGGSIAGPAAGSSSAEQLDPHLGWYRAPTAGRYGLPQVFGQAPPGLTQRREAARSWPEPPPEEPMALQRPPAVVWNLLDPLGVWAMLGGALGQVMRAVPGLTVTSWWRSRAHNAAVGGDPFSQHLLGLAFDLAGSRASMLRAQQVARALGWETFFEGDHLHLQAFRAGQVPRQLYTLV